MNRNKILSTLGPIKSHLIFFLSTWLLLAVYYGDVLYIAEQNSFFSTQGTLMQFVTGHRPYGYLWWLGRALLQLFYYPWLGALLTAIMLTLISGLCNYVFRFSRKLFLLQFLPAFVWLAHCLYQGYDLYYQTETGKILGIPFCILVILILQSIFMRTFSKKRIHTAFVERDCKRRDNIFRIVTLIALPVILIAVNEHFRPYVRPTAHMQCALQKEDWEEMETTARECGISARPIAAYYAIALMQTGGITQSLFDIEYNYADIYLHDRSGSKDFGTNYYEADGNFYAGLLNSAYRNSMERLTMEGPTALSLKMLAECSLLNGETKVCDKYLDILESMPFEKKFVEKTRTFNHQPQLIAQDARFSKVLNLLPTNDSFETFYKEPTFLGYNICLMQGRSMDALNASLAACLYTKLMPEFLMRTEPLIGTALPRNVEDALTMESKKNTNINRVFNLSELSTSRYDMFLRMAAGYRGQKEEGARALKEQFLGFYPYYYFYGNLNATESQNESKNKSEHSVN